jgi:transcriptional antiterminator
MEESAEYGIDLTMVQIRGRDIQVILYLLAQRYPVSASKISLQVGVNANTLRKDNPRMRAILEENGLSLIARPRLGLRIDGSPRNRQILQDKLDLLGGRILPRRKRIWYIAQSFLSEERIPTIEGFCELLDISRPTALKYIREVKKWLSTRGIDVFGRPGFGYYVKGDEESIRDATIDCIRNYLEFELQAAALEFSQGNLKHDLHGVFENMDSGAIVACIDMVQTQLKRRFVDEDLLTIALSIAVCIRRIRGGHNMAFQTKRMTEILANSITPVVGSSIRSLRDRFQVEFADGEVSYLALKFVGLRTQNTDGMSDVTATLQFEGIAGEISQLASGLLGLSLDKEDEFIAMLSHHLESTIAKIRMGVRIKNPTLEAVKREYPLPYAVAERASKMIEDRFHLEVPDGETGYIALYIAASVEKVRRPAKKRVVVICPMGIATSKLLCYKIAREIPEIEVVQAGSIRQLEEGRVTREVDLIVSTVQLPEIETPSVVVSPFLTTEDKNAIKRLLRGNSKKGSSVKQ